MEIDLSRFRSRIAIGTAGDIVLDGPGVMPRHAELMPARNGSSADAVVLRTLDGETWVERGPVLTRITGDHVLVDGDLIIIASYRLRYRNVGSRLPEAPTSKEVIPWLK